MALSRRTGQRFQASIWPGFVDAMTALLLVLMFVLTIFMVVQFVLRETITGQATELDDLSAQIIGLADALGLEQQRAAGLEDQVTQLDSNLADARAQANTRLALIATLSAKSSEQAAELEQQRTSISSFEAQVASLLNAQNEAKAQNIALNERISEAQAAQAKLLTDQEALQLALAKARDEIDQQVEVARLAAARKDALQAMIADLRNQAMTRDESLAGALARLDAEMTRSSDLRGELATAVAQLSDAEKAQLAEKAAAVALQERLAGVADELTEKEAARLVDAAAAEALRARLKNADTELTAMTLALEEQRKRAEETLTLLAAAEAAKRGLQQDSEVQLSAAQKQAAFLATAQKTLSEQEAQTAEEQRKLALLNEQVAALRTQLGSLQSLLDVSAAKDAQSNVQLQALGSQLNTALARVASEEKRRRKLEEAERLRLQAEAKDLARYKSEFFGQLRDLLGREEGVRIVGDRFVFSSEVLFQTGDVALSDEGRAQIARIAAILKRVSDAIPPEIDWVIRVDGHTDNQPLSGLGRYRNNWELSQGRALSVVRYMSEGLGISPSRLAANGFGEFQPINPANTAQARAQNRRIELKITER